MRFTPNLEDWLQWWTRARFLCVTLLLVAVLSIHQLTPFPLARRAFLVVIGIWYVVAIFFGILRKLAPGARGQAGWQVAADMCMVTGLVYATGGYESYFNSLYLLLILMGSLLFRRPWVYAIACGSFLLLWSTIALSFFGYIPRTSLANLNPGSLQVWGAMNFIAFAGVAFLGNILAESVRSKHAELTLRGEEIEDLRVFNKEIIDSMRGGLLLAGGDGRILVLNHAGSEITGWPAGELEGKNLREIFPEFWPEGSDPQTGPAVQRKEVLCRTASGEMRMLGLSAAPLRSAQNAGNGFVFTFQDLTELKRLEHEVAVRDRLAAVGRLSAGIAHEIRQPLTAMTGALKELSRFAPMADDDRRLVQIVGRESQRLDQIVTDFLEFAREKSYELKPQYIAPLLDEALTLIERHSSQWRVEREYLSPLACAAVDRDRIKQVFWNLCNNALRAMEPGGVLTVHLEADGRFLRVSFRDTGKGLDPAQTARIFEPFHSNFPGGTGLGLAISYQIVQAHNGLLTFSSRKGEGATFTVELPAVGAPAREERGVHADAARGAS